ncbi:pyridoxamine 5'-phosphate oxidase family protein [Streptomyces sp. NPDC097727]|uniref:pyridoxamine 5'-phosphate oxidase family protein n=1 Tax=Streptomyces sp. NPDC097727 TaxID=3366092 RepID=UPI003808CF16
MSGFEPFAERDTRYSHESATAGPWSAAKELLTRAEMYWLSTVPPDGSPHVTPLIGEWSQGALHFSTGVSERKGRNPAADPEAVLTTGDNTLSEAIDVVVEGRAERVTDGARLNRPAAAWESKYGPERHFDVQDSTFRHACHVALVFKVSPRTVFGFGKGTTYSRTRWRFS